MRTISLQKSGEREEEADFVADEEYFRQILLILLNSKGNDFFFYKQATIRRRIQSRVVATKSGSLPGYLSYLGKNEAEQEILVLSLLIPVTSFFRDKPVFDKLRNSVFPAILSNKQEGETLRIWVTACSTGQEAYSMAICLHELIGDSKIRIQIFATDVSGAAIKTARLGIYTKKEVAGLSHEYLNSYFLETNGRYRIKKPIRELCVFAEHNFVKDPPFSKVDFVSCRNVLIYFEPYLQKKALTNFHYALNPKGFLLLGTSESTEIVADLFVPAGKSDKIFTRKDAPGKYVHVAGSKITHHTTLNPNLNLTTTTMQNDYQKKADDLMLRQFMPAGVVINEAMDIVQFRGDCSRYLLQTSGAPTFNVLKLAKSSLSFELRSLLQKARSAKHEVIKAGILVHINDSMASITIRAIPLSDLAEPHFLVLFQEVPVDSTVASGNATTGDIDLRIRQLEQELAQAREDMREVSGEQEAANSELQSANEELLSSGEEMQSLNEELETSQEELQSINEELTVSNTELNSLNEQLTKAKNYAESIVATIHQPLLVLDKNLVVITANKAFYKMFGLGYNETRGQSIYKLDNDLWDTPAFRLLLQEGTFAEVEMILHHTMLGNRNILFSGTNILQELDEDQMLLLVIEDITERRKLQQAERELLDKFQKLVFQAPVAMCILKGRDYTVDVANDQYLGLIGKNADIVGKPIFVSMPELLSQGLKALLDKVMDTGTAFYAHEHELCLERSNQEEQCFFNFVYQPMLNPTSDVIGVIVVVTEVTEQVIARKKLESKAQMVQELLMTAPGWICTLMGPLHVFDIINESFKQVFGKRAVSGQPILEALPELLHQGIKEILEDVYKTGKPFTAYDMAISLVRDDDAPSEIAYFNFSYQAIYDDDKQIIGVLAFGYEVTAQVRAKNNIIQIQMGHTRELEARVKQRTIELISANELLNFKNNSLRKLNTELQSFAYISSHDLQEPLRKIQTFSSMLLADESSKLSPDGQNYLERMQTASVRMQTLIRDLLAYSHSNISAHEIEPTDLNPLVDAVIIDYAVRIQETRATVEVGRLCTANIISFQFSQILHKLFSNALKFARSNVPLQISLQSRTDEGVLLLKEDPQLAATHFLPGHRYCHFSFKDNGIGFDQAYGQKIFDIFQKLHSRNEYEGTGIGLAIVKKIVEHHYGFITASGVSDQGATFNIYLPA